MTLTMQRHHRPESQKLFPDLYLFMILYLCICIYICIKTVKNQPCKVISTNNHKNWKSIRNCFGLMEETQLIVSSWAASWNVCTTLTLNVEHWSVSSLKQHSTQTSFQLIINPSWSLEPVRACSDSVQWPLPPFSSLFLIRTLLTIGVLTSLF